MNIQTIGYIEGVFNFDAEEWARLKGNGLDSLELDSKLRFTPGVPVGGIQYDMQLTTDNHIILKYGFTIGFHVNEWDGIDAASHNLEENTDQIAEIIEQTWPVVIGAVAAKTFTPQAQSLILPSIDTKELAAETAVLRIPPRHKD